MKSGKINPIKNKSALQQWLARKKNNNVTKGIEIRPKNQPIPLSYGQQRLWFLQQLYPDNPFYHYADIYRFKGKLHVENLIEAFKLVVRRHEILRTTFEIIDGKPFQKINQKEKLDIVQMDLRHLNIDQEDEHAQAVAKEESCRPLDLLKGPLIRLSFLQFKEDEFSLVLTIHHIITDKWSMQLLRDEMAAEYRDLELRAVKNPAPLAIQYSDFAYWQRTKKVNASQLEYWQKKLSGKLPTLNLPTDYSRPYRPTFKGEFSSKNFSALLTDQIRNLCKQSGSTLFVVILAAFKVLLKRYADQNDILVGVPFTNRNKIELESLIGFFNETLVLRSNLENELSFLDFLQQVKQTVHEAFSNSSTPFDVLVQTLKPDRYMSTNPLFQVMFLFHNVPSMPSFGANLTLDHAPFDFGVAKFDLTLYVAEHENQINAIFEYASDLFEQGTIERMHEHLKVLLEQVVRDPNQKISEISILSETEKHRILKEWNQTDSPPPQESCIHNLIEQKAFENPEAIAVSFKDQMLTYQELNICAENLAVELRKSGLKTNSPVGLFTERSLEMAIGIFGILKAGGAYLPLDPDYPKERIEFMIEDAQASLVLTQKHLLDILPNTQSNVLTLEKFRAANKKKEDILSPLNLSTENLAYIIYTSGSSGKPKGVPVTHKNLVHSTVARFHYYPNSPEAFLLLSSFSFDSSLVGIFWTLCSGGQLVLGEKQIEQDLMQMGDVIAKNEVTHTLLLPTLYETILEHISIEKITKLDTVIVAGESCPTSLPKKHFEQLPNTLLYNEYGPTEATVWCTVHQITESDIGKPVSIGRPIPYTNIYILDENMDIVPIGMEGDLYVGGKGITNGYLNRADLTREKFLKNPFDDKEGAILYKTGDLAKYRSDGTIEFLGRSDHQIKIRGHRIELDEIKSVLKQHSNVEDAVVIFQKENNEPDFEKLLLAFDSLEEEEAEYLLKMAESYSTN